jgi:hypothetical protein
MINVVSVLHDVDIWPRQFFWVQSKGQKQDQNYFQKRAQNFYLFLEQ